VPPVVEPSPVAPDDWFFGLPLHGTLSLRERARWNSDDSDQDLYIYLNVNIGDPRKDPITGCFSMRAVDDLDGHRNTTGFYSYDSIEDTYDSSFNARIYQLYADIHEIAELKVLRVGRQVMRELPLMLQIDGVSAETVPFKEAYGAQAGAYAGVPVHPYESSYSGDSVFGLWLRADGPWKGLWARADLMQARDEYLLGTKKNTLVNLAAWERTHEYWVLHYKFSLLEGESRDQKAQIAYQNPGSEITARVTFYQLFKTESYLANEVDDFFRSLGSLFPYEQWSALLSIGFGEGVIVQAGMELRNLRDTGDEGEFNHEFNHFWVAPTVTGMPWPGFSVSLTADSWDVKHGDAGDSFTWGLDVTHQCTPELRFSVGTAYAAYQIDALTGVEKQNARTVYLKAAWKVQPGLKVDVSLEDEHSIYPGMSGLDDFYTLKVGATQSF